MRDQRAYYANSLAAFQQQSNNEILGIIHRNNPSFETVLQQSNTWEVQIAILKDQLGNLQEGRLLFEYVIPRMGKRVDVVFLHQNLVFLLEFKCGATAYASSALDQVMDYALDLRHFHKESHDKLLVPILIASHAEALSLSIKECNSVLEPLQCNKDNLISAIREVVLMYQKPAFDYLIWERSEYLPTPTIIEAAQALYRGHNVQEITRSDAGAENLTITTDEINRIIDYSRAHQKKAICFVTGVPGAGKTLVGLNIAVLRSHAKKGEHAVFLSGNQPLVTVLQEALARDKVVQLGQEGSRMTKKEALRNTSSFIQIIHKYRDSFVANDHIPPERIAIFDEAQRAWTHSKIREFMATKKGVLNFAFSEPEFLISTMDRHQGWAVVICLVGGGQEINTGEAGLPEWFDSLRRSFSHWDVYITPQLNDEEYRRNTAWETMIHGLNVFQREPLHLATSIRSFRTPQLAAFVKALLDVDRMQASALYVQIKEKYPLVLTRDLHKAKAWVKDQCRGTTRYGLLASSSGLRLKAEGIFVKNDISVANWFLNGKEDIRSSYALEDVVTEFDIQGLELDYTLLAWDADLRFDGQDWAYHNFRGAVWNRVKDEERKRYLKNTYRVLLTRARQGMAIFVPEGSDHDMTRQRKYYDKTYAYLKSLGIIEL